MIEMAAAMGFALLLDCESPFVARTAEAVLRAAADHVDTRPFIKEAKERGGVHARRAGRRLEESTAAFPLSLPVPRLHFLRPPQVNWGDRWHKLMWDCHRASDDADEETVRKEDASLRSASREYGAHLVETGLPRHTVLRMFREAMEKERKCGRIPVE